MKNHALVRDVIVVAGCIFVGGMTVACRQKVQDKEQSGGIETWAAPLTAANVEGYIHSAERSLLNLADTTTEAKGDAKVRAKSVFAEQVRSAAKGWSVGFARGTEAPFGNTLEEHNSAVLEEFLARGLPRDQVGPVGGTVTMSSAHHVSDALSDSPPNTNKLVGWTSRVARQIEGIPVVDSFAIASLGADRTAQVEAVYWPDIPAEVVDEAIRLKQRLDDPIERARYEASLALSVEGRRTQVVIRHSPIFDQGPFDVHAAVDVSGVETEDTRHFDTSGKELFFVVRPGQPQDTSPRDVSRLESDCTLSGQWTVQGTLNLNVAIDDRNWSFETRSSRLEGTYSFVDGRLSIWDSSGVGASACDDQATGEYQVFFSDECTAVRLEVSSDTCGRRKATLDGLTLLRK